MEGVEICAANLTLVVMVQTVAREDDTGQGPAIFTVDLAGTAKYTDPVPPLGQVLHGETVWRGVGCRAWLEKRAPGVLDADFNALSRREQRR